MEISYSSGMDDPVRELIRGKLNEHGLKMSAVSMQIGRNHAYLQQFLNRRIPLELEEKDRHRLADILRVDESALRGPKTASIPLGLSPFEDRPAHNATIAGPIRLAHTVPAYGHAAGGSEGQFPLNGNKIADILAPPSLYGVRDAYAVYVAGTSMLDRYRPGEVVFVNPRLPYRRNDYVVAQISSDAGEPPDAYVKMYISMDERHLRLMQHNPEKELRFPRRRVVSVHRIVMGGDG